MSEFFQRQIYEIRRDLALRLAGSFLCLGHLVCFVYWNVHFRAYEMVSNQTVPVCWPFFESCYRYRFLGPEALKILFALYGLGSLVGAVLFLPARWTKYGYLVLAALEIFRAGAILQDYRLLSTQHYMAFFAAMSFLFLAQKRNALRLQIVLFYVWAGFLKLNPEWLSGRILEGTWHFHEELLPLQCAYVLFLELVMIWGLLSNRKGIFWGSFFQVVLFHAISWHLVTFFYPLIMACLLVIFPLSQLIRDPNPRPLRIGAFQPAAYAWFGVFSLLQAVPYFYPGKAELRGGGRMLYSMYMFHARVECTGHMDVEYPSGKTDRMDLRKEISDTDFRQMCQPLVALNIARHWCRKLHDETLDKFSLNLYLQSRYHGESGYTPVIDIHDFCNQEIRYRLFRPNDWILVERNLSPATEVRDSTMLPRSGRSAPQT